jgi:hypothetical protein
MAWNRTEQNRMERGAIVIAVGWVVPVVDNAAKLTVIYNAAIVRGR